MYRKYRGGFTLVELMLAMGFVSILLVSIAMLTIQITNLYTQGLTMKEINQAGAEVSDDIRRTIASADIQGQGVQVIGDQNGRRVLCTGKYSYVANNPADIEENDAANLIKYQNNTIVRFAKVRDLGGTLCTSLSSPLSGEATELLGGGDRSLVVRNVAISPSAPPAVGAPFKADYDSGRMLYLVTLTLSAGVTTELNESASQCRPPDDLQSGGEYCAIDTFRVVARVGNTYKNE